MSKVGKKIDKSITTESILIDGENATISNSSGDLTINPGSGQKLIIQEQIDVDNINIDGNTISSTDTDGDINVTPDGTGEVNVGGALNVDNIKVDGNTISSTNTDGDINLTPNGTGNVVAGGSISVDNITIDGNTISATDVDGDINITPNGTGGVVAGGSVSVDNITIDGNTISSTDVDGDINLTPNGAGNIVASGALDMGANKVTSSATPTNGNDLTNKTYVDGVAQGLRVKDAARVATTVNGTLASDFENGDTVDGVVLVTGDRILIKNQSTQTENGIYEVQATGAPVRTPDADVFSELVSAFLFIEEGSVNADTGWVCTANAGGIIGVEDLPFTQFSGAGSITTDGEGIEITGTELSLELDGTSLSKSSSGLKINSDLTLTGSTVATSSDTDLELSPDGTGEINSNSTHNFTATLKGAQENDAGLYAASSDVTLPTTFIKRLTNVSIQKEIGGIVAPSAGSMFFVLSNNDGETITIKNESSSIATAANRIITGSGNDILLSDTACLFMFYDTTSSRWRVIGGSGGGGRISTGTFAAPVEIDASGITATPGTDEDIYVDTASGAVNVTTDPQISAGTVDGQTLRIIGTSNDNYIILEDGDGLALNGSWSSYAGSILTLRWDNSSSLWRDDGRNE